MHGASWKLVTGVGQPRNSWRALPSFSPRAYSLLATQQRSPRLTTRTPCSSLTPSSLTSPSLIHPFLTSPSRSLSSDSTFYSVIHVAENYFQTLHSLTHMPWWAVILTSTVALRSCITLPLAVYQNRIIAKMELLLPTLKEYQEAVQHNLVVKCRRENLPVEEANRRITKAVRHRERNSSLRYW